MNKPGIPNEGDTVKVIEVSSSDGYSDRKQLEKILGKEGRVEHLDIWKNGWLAFRLYYPDGSYNSLFEAKVKILKRKKGGKK